MKLYVYCCVHCGEEFDAATHFSRAGKLVEHCDRRAILVRVKEPPPRTRSC
jgi:predicted nucleic acid-binding Zn ribbon protein